MISSIVNGTIIESSKLIVFSHSETCINFKYNQDIRIPVNNECLRELISSNIIYDSKFEKVKINTDETIRQCYNEIHRKITSFINGNTKKKRRGKRGAYYNNNYSFPQKTVQNNLTIFIEIYKNAYSLTWNTNAAIKQKVAKAFIDIIDKVVRDENKQ